ncbi:MAG: serine hydrolase [Xanthomonadaceae bacterium]|nr:serine hydrolase [Xanthomonadaceae bacterium]
MSTRSMATTLALLLTMGAAVAAPAARVSAPAPATSAGVAAPAPAPASTAAAVPENPGAATAPAMTAQDVQTFFDSLVPYAIHRADIAGGVIVVVKDGKVLFAKGYGYADVAKRTPVIADRTLFRPGSISKTFTWTAVMQLVGEGKIDLDADVNRYLDFKIPEKFGKPITMRDLMTMTPGFEDTVHDEFVSTPQQLFPIGEYVKKDLPTRIFPPGRIVAYSNYGATLAGYIVQRLSGEPFDQYIADHIFKPLGMDHSTFAQPLPAALVPNMSVGYRTASNKKTIPFESVEIAPAGSLTSSGTDMARFMIAQLSNGQYDGASILSPAMTKLMHSPQSRMAPGMNGYDLGFYQENRNGLRIIGHAGDTEAFHSDMHLLLDKHVGVFMSFNSAGKAGAVEQVRTALFRAFLDRYFPYVAPQEQTVADPKADAARVAGWYLSSRRIVSGLRLLYALTQTQVTANPDGTIKIAALTDLSGTPKTWREVGPLTYREVGGQTHTKFVAGRHGRIRYWISDDFLPVMVFQPVHGLRNFGLLKPLGTAFILVLLLTLAIWIGGAIVRRRMRSKLVLTRSEFWWRLASRLGVVMLLVLMFAWFEMFNFVFATASGKLNGYLMVMYVLGVLAAIGALAMLVEAGLRVVRGPGGWLVRLGEFVLGLCALYALWGIVVYGLANFSFTY